MRHQLAKVTLRRADWRRHSGRIVVPQQRPAEAREVLATPGMTTPSNLHILVSISKQRLYLFQAGVLVREYVISTSKKGPGEEHGSGCTPRGMHTICEKIGAGEPIGTVFVGRKPTGRVLSESEMLKCPGGDWITTRILWLDGLEQGVNRGANVDSRKRFIYIHGCADELGLGTPLSLGCIRMKNTEILELFEKVSVGIQIEIKE